MRVLSDIHLGGAGHYISHRFAVEAARMDTCAL